MQILHESRRRLETLEILASRMMFLGGYEEMIPNSLLVLMRATKGCGG
jgi:hypothetical protein